MYATDTVLRLGLSHSRAALPALLGFAYRTGFPAEQVTTLTADWDDAPPPTPPRAPKPHWNATRSHPNHEVVHRTTGLSLWCCAI